MYLFKFPNVFVQITNSICPIMTFVFYFITAGSTLSILTELHEGLVPQSGKYCICVQLHNVSFTFFCHLEFWYFSIFPLSIITVQISSLDPWKILERYTLLWVFLFQLMVILYFVFLAIAHHTLQPTSHVIMSSHHTLYSTYIAIAHHTSQPTSRVITSHNI